MNLSKMNFALVGFMIMGVLSLNIINPFAMSNNEFDVKGMANEMSISTAPNQSEAALIPTTVVIEATMWVLFSSKICDCNARAHTNINVFDGVAKVDADKLAMNKLD